MISRNSFPKDLIKIVRTIKKAGYKCYVVGGGVRDILLKEKPGTWDLTTDARPQAVMKLFKKVVPTGIKYGTVTIIEKGEKYEVTTFRRDEKYFDGRHPENVRFSNSLKDDLARRDFTINAIAYDPTTAELVDEFGGLKDLRSKLIRAVGDPVERFSEDGLRPLRACRFAAKLNFRVEPATFKAISKCLKTAKKVSVERVHDELMKMMEAEKPSIGIELMRSSGLLKLYIPELLRGVGVRQPKPFHKEDVYLHSIHTCDEAPKENAVLRFAALLHDISKPECKEGMTFYDHENVGAAVAEKIMRRLKFSNANIEYAKTLIKNHMFNYSNDWSDSAVRRFINRVGPSYVGDLFELRRADVRAMGRRTDKEGPRSLKSRVKRVIKEENALHIKDLKVNGNDVMKALKIPPSPRVGEILNKLLEKVLDDPKLNLKRTLLEMVKSFK